MGGTINVTVPPSTITFKPNQVRTLYYHSGSHTNMGGTINVINPPVESIIFSPNQERTLYYHCGNHANMGNVINVTSNINYEIEVFAGELGTNGNQDGHKSNATFYGIKGIEIDLNDDIYVSCNQGQTIRKISNNNVETIAGVYQTSGSVNGTNGTLTNPCGICLDQHSDLYITESNGSIRILGLDLTVSSDNISGYINDPDYDSPLNEISTHSLNIVDNNSKSLVIDSNNNIYITKYNSKEVIKKTPSGTESIIWSNSLKYPNYLAIDSNDDVYIVYGGGQSPYCIDKYSSILNTFSLFWMSNKNTDVPGPICVYKDKIYAIMQDYDLENANARLVEIDSTHPYLLIQDLSYIIDQNVTSNYNISGLIADSKGNFYMSEVSGDNNLSGRILKYNYQGGIRILAGSYSNDNITYLDGYNISARLNNPSGLCVDTYDNVYIADSGNNRIRKINKDEYIGTFAGTENAGNTDGPIVSENSPETLSARLNNPISLQFNKYGDLYILDGSSGSIRTIKFNHNKNLITERVPDDIFYLKDTQNTIFQTLDNFPNLEALSKWKMSINFNWNGSGDWQSIIGSMYSNELTNNRGWGLWISYPSREIHWSGGPPFESNYLYNIDNMVISPDVNYKIDITKGTSDILIENSNPDLSIDYLEVKTLKEDTHGHQYNSIQCYGGYIYYIAAVGIVRISPLNTEPELVQSNLLDPVSLLIKSFVIDKTTGTIFFTTSNAIHRLLPNGVLNLNIVDITESSWNGTRGGGYLFTSPSGELFSVTSGSPTKIFRHYDGNSTSTVKSFGVQVSGAVIDSQNNIILSAHTSPSTLVTDDRLLLSFDYNGTGTWLGLPGIRQLIGAGNRGISSLTIDSEDNIYIGVGMIANTDYRIIKINKSTLYTTYEIIAGGGLFVGNPSQDDNINPLQANINSLYAMDIDSFSDLYFMNLNDVRVMRFAPPPINSTKSMLSFKLINLDNGEINTNRFLYSPLDVKTVKSGGDWDTNSSEIFNGHISKISVNNLEDITSIMTTLPQSFSKSTYNFIPESTTIQIIPAWTESIYTPETSTTVYIDGYTTTINVTTLNFVPMAFMSRLDYIEVTIDSFSNIEKVPVNFLDIELLNNIDTDLQINMVKYKGKYTLEVSVNSSEEVKWFGLLNLKKIYIKNAESRELDNRLKYNTSDNIINWQPIFRTDTSVDNCFKFIEGLEFKNISPFSDRVITQNTTYHNSVIDDSLLIRHKSVTLNDINNENSAREIVNGEFIDNVSSSFDYNIYGYQSMLMIQPTLTDVKKLTTSYSHILYMNNNEGNTGSVLFENEFGNSFTKDSTKNSSDFMTSFINNDNPNEYYMSLDGNTKINNKKLQYVYQLKEKEVDYQPILTILYCDIFVQRL